MMCLQIRKRKKDSFRRSTVERSHREVIILSLPDSKLFGKVCTVVGLNTLYGKGKFFYHMLYKLG